MAKLVDAPHSKCGGFGHESSSLSLPIVTIGSNRSKPSVELFLRMDITLNPGDLAPELILPDAEGNLVRLSDFRGKRVVLYFYPRDNTPGCRKEACGFRDIYGEYQENNIIILGVSTDNPVSHRKFINKYQLPFPLLVDDGGKVAYLCD